jgi:hypothetical protein
MERNHRVNEDNAEIVTRATVQLEDEKMAADDSSMPHGPNAIGALATILCVGIVVALVAALVLFNYHRNNNVNAINAAMVINSVTSQVDPA